MLHSLEYLTNFLLKKQTNREIQNNHDSIEDSILSLELVEYLIKNNKYNNLPLKVKKKLINKRKIERIENKYEHDNYLKARLRSQHLSGYKTLNNLS